MSQGGLGYALHDEPRSGQPRKYQTDQEAEVVALACSAPPGGRKRWTVRLLTAAAQRRPGLVGVNRETIRQMLKKTTVNPAQADVVRRPDHGRIPEKNVRSIE